MFKTKIIAFVLSSSLTLGLLSLPTTISYAAKDQTIDLPQKIYEFGEKSEYGVDSSEPTASPEVTAHLGYFSLIGDISQTYTKDGFTAYEIEDDTVFSLHYNYDLTLFKARSDDMEWHLSDDDKKTVNKVELDDKIAGGAVIMQTSFDGKKWVTGNTMTNICDDFDFNNENGINDIQLENGCYYRFIVAYKTEKKTKDSNVLFVDTSDYEYKKYAEVYEFYASYKNIDEVVSGKKMYFEVGGMNNNPYTVGTKKNDYVGSERIDSKDPHYGWNLGSFCLSGFTDNGDSSDIYFKTAGNKLRLTFKLEQDIKKLNGNSDLEILSDKKGSDGNFQTQAHDMGHGELVIKYTDPEGKTSTPKYSNFLEALTYPGADTTIQLFEEGDYEVHLDYAINDKKGIDSKTYYRMSFGFKIRNSNCMVYIFDAQTGNELGNGSIAPNGFRIDTAKSPYQKVNVKKDIMNETSNGLVEDTRFNRAATDGEIFNEEGIYTISATNRYNADLKTEKKVYVGTNNILTAYTHNIDENGNPAYTIEKLNNMVDKGWTITDNGDLLPPESDESAVPVITSSATITADESTKSETTALQTTAVPNETKKSPIIPIVCVVLILTGAGGGVGYYVFKNKKKQ